MRIRAAAARGPGSRSTVSSAAPSRRAVTRPKQRRLGQQSQLAVQDHACRAAGHRRGRRAGADASAGPHRQVQLRCAEELLEEDEGAQRADPAAALGTPGDQPVCSGASRRPCLVEVRDLHEYPSAGGDVGDLPRRFDAQDDGAGPVVTLRGAVPREILGIGTAGRRDPDPEPARRPAPQPVQRIPGPPVALSEVEYPEAAGPADGGGQPGVRFTEGGDANDQLFGAYSRHESSPHER